MTGTITYILSRAGYRAMNGPLSDERRRLAGAEPPAAYVSYDPRLLAGAGWYGYRIALKGGDRQMVERARYMLAERYILRDGYEYYADGVYVIGVLLRERVPHYGIGGGAPTPEPDALNFYMPNGGTISLNKTGNPTVVELEYSIDRGQTWTVWQPDIDGNRSLTLSAGGKVYIRNASTVSTRFSIGDLDFYNFSFTTIAYADGNTNSLLCKNPDNAIITNDCFNRLYIYSVYLYSPSRLPSTTIAYECYNRMYQGTSISESPILPATILYGYSYYCMFANCINLHTITTYMLTGIDSNTISGWVTNVAATGDFYCPAELTIPTGTNGIPSGWTRHDI